MWTETPSPSTHTMALRNRRSRGESETGTPAKTPSTVSRPPSTATRRRQRREKVEADHADDDPDTVDDPSPPETETAKETKAVIKEAETPKSRNPRRQKAPLKTNKKATDATRKSKRKSKKEEEEEEEEDDDDDDDDDHTGSGSNSGSISAELLPLPPPPTPPLTPSSTGLLDVDAGRTGGRMQPRPKSSTTHLARRRLVIETSKSPPITRHSLPDWTSSSPVKDLDIDYARPSIRPYIPVVTPRRPLHEEESHISKVLMARSPVISVDLTSVPSRKRMTSKVMTTTMVTASELLNGYKKDEFETGSATSSEQGTSSISIGMSPYSDSDEDRMAAPDEDSPSCVAPGEEPRWQSSRCTSLGSPRHDCTIWKESTNLVR